MTDRSPSPPTDLGRKYVRYVVGFGVGVAVGMAPFLGLLEVPFFAPLLSLFPPSAEGVRGAAIPLSSFLMGLVTVGIQFAYGEEISRRWLRWSFAATFLALVAGLVVMLYLHTENVLSIPNVRTTNERTTSVWLVVGGPRPDPPLPGCPCTREESDVSCVEGIAFERVKLCWGDRQVKRAERSLTLAYLFLTGGFGALIGLLLLQEESRRKSTGKHPRQASTSGSS